MLYHLRPFWAEVFCLFQLQFLEKEGIKMQANKQKSMLRLVESGLMLAMATVLSLVKVLDLPYGGSITAFSALPLILIAYRIHAGNTTASPAPCATSYIALNSCSI